MRRSAVAIAGLFGAFCRHPVWAGYPDIVVSRLGVHVPHNLFKEDGYDHAVALFGVPDAGGSLVQSVYYTPDDLCSPIVDTHKGYPERQMEKDGKTMQSWQSPYILMVEFGGCAITQKVRNAQLAGAAGVVIADNVCLCSDYDCTATNDGSCSTTLPIMADDGSGGDISIPSFLMFKLDAEAVKGKVMANQPVVLELTWGLPSPDDRVMYDIFVSPTDPFSRDFLTQFKPIAQALGDRAYFSPHLYIHDGVRSQCQGNDGENFCYNICTNNGRYCGMLLAGDPANSGISGADMVRESLRRLCMWNAHGSEDGVGTVWWDYIREFTEFQFFYQRRMRQGRVQTCSRGRRTSGTVYAREWRFDQGSCKCLFGYCS